MPKDAPPNDGARPGAVPDDVLATARGRVSGMQVKLHRWAAADPGRAFDDLFNLVHDPATLIVAWDRVASNRGARAAGSDGLTVAQVAAQMSVPVFLEGLRADIKSGGFRPQPVRERLIPKPGKAGKVRRLGIPTVADRVVQAAVKLVLEPIFEAGFKPVSYGFRPRRRAHDAIAEIRQFGSKGYHWVLDADIEACFDRIDHTALLAQVRRRVGDKRVLRLVKAFLKAGILTELGEKVDSPLGTPQGGILSPLLANIALHVLDEYLHAPWEPGGSMMNTGRRHRRRVKGLPNWRLVRFADDMVVLVHGSRADTLALQDRIAGVLATLGLRLSPSKTQVVHARDGFDFLGFHIRWQRKHGTSKWYWYNLVGKDSIRSVRTRIRRLTRRTSQQDLRAVLEQINPILRGWTNYFRHVVAQRVFDGLRQFVWWRIVRMMRHRHRWNWGAVRRWLTDRNGRWRPIQADGTVLFDPAAVPIIRYRYRGDTIPSPWATAA